MFLCRCLDAWLCVGVCVHGCVAVFACMRFVSVFGVIKDSETEAGRNCQLSLFFLRVLTLIHLILIYIYTRHAQ